MWSQKPWALQQQEAQLNPGQVDWAALAQAWIQNKGANDQAGNTQQNQTVNQTNTPPQQQQAPPPQMPPLDQIPLPGNPPWQQAPWQQQQSWQGPPRPPNWGQQVPPWNNHPQGFPQWQGNFNNPQQQQQWFGGNQQQPMPQNNTIVPPENCATPPVPPLQGSMDQGPPPIPAPVLPIKPEVEPPMHPPANGSQEPDHVFDYNHGNQDAPHNDNFNYPPENFNDFRPEDETREEEDMNFDGPPPPWAGQNEPPWRPQNQWGPGGANPPWYDGGFSDSPQGEAGPFTQENFGEMDAVKRRKLPPWIREGLEKMEREKQKKLEKEMRDKEESQAIHEKEKEKDPNKSKFESDDESDVELPDATNQDEEEESGDNRQDDSGPEAEPDMYKMTEEEMMLKVRRMLTEILLNVTNSESEEVAEEVYDKEKKKGQFIVKVIPIH